MHPISAAHALLMIAAIVSVLPGSAAATTAQPTAGQLHAELTQILAALPGVYAGQAPDPANPTKQIAVFHKIVRVDAPQFGGDAVFYHQISRDDADSTAPAQRKIYVFDRNPKRAYNAMRAFVFAHGQGSANLERDAAALQALDPAKLLNFPLACAIRWSRDEARKAFVAQVRREACSYESPAFKQRISPQLTYVLTKNGFAFEDVLYGADGNPLSPPSGLLPAKRTTPAPP